MAKFKYQVTMINNEVIQIDADYISLVDGAVLFEREEGLGGDENAGEAAEMVANGEWKHVKIVEDLRSGEKT